MNATGLAAKHTGALFVPHRRRHSPSCIFACLAAMAHSPAAYGLHNAPVRWQEPSRHARGLVQGVEELWLGRMGCCRLDTNTW